jgi:catalase
MAVHNGGSAPNYETVSADGTSPHGFGNLYRIMTPDAQDRLTSNIARAMKDVSDAVKKLQISHFNMVEPAYGAAVARKLAAFSAADREPAKSLSVAKEA